MAVNIVVRSLYFALWFRRRRFFDFVITSSLEESIAAWLALRILRNKRKLIIYNQMNVTGATRNVGWFIKQLIRVFVVANREAGCVMGMSEGVLADLRNRGVSTIQYLHPGCVELREIRRLASEKVVNASFQNSDLKTIIYVGRLINQQKRVDLLLSAVAQLLSKPECGNFRVLIIGDGRDRQDLEHLAERLGIAGIVTFLGEQTNPFPWMSHAQVLVLCSDYEGFATVIIEAMACGVPVVATDCPSGPAEILSQGGGLLVSVGDASQLGEAILKILSDESLWKVLSRQSLARVRSFECSQVTARLDQFLMNLNTEQA